MNFMDIIYPVRRCPLCGNKAFKYGLCKSCLEEMEFIKDRICMVCGKPLGDNYEGDVCPDCVGGRSFDKARSALVYNERLHDVVYLFKYKGKLDMAEPFGKMMADVLKSWNPDVDVIIPVPMHPERLAQRGYNQAYLLARVVSRISRLPLREDLVRIKHTSVQAKLDKLERFDNMKGAFCIKGGEKICCDNVLLIDDILTTGATADAASSILKAGGAHKVYVLTLATGRNT